MVEMSASPFYDRVCSCSIPLIIVSQISSGLQVSFQNTTFLLLWDKLTLDKRFFTLRQRVKFQLTYFSLASQRAVISFSGSISERSYRTDGIKTIIADSLCIKPFSDVCHLVQVGILLIKICMSVLRLCFHKFVPCLKSSTVANVDIEE